MRAEGDTFHERPLIDRIHGVLMPVAILLVIIPPITASVGVWFLSAVFLVTLLKHPIAMLLATVPALLVGLPTFHLAGNLMEPVLMFLMRLSEGRCPECHRPSLEVTPAYRDDSGHYVKCCDCGKQVFINHGKWRDVSADEWNSVHEIIE